MKNIRFAISFLATVTVVMVATSFAQAQNNRSWVASNGDDNAACTLTAPCRTFQGAFNKTNTQGEIDVIDSADYSNANSNVGAISGTNTLAITRSVTIDGGGIGFMSSNTTTNADAVAVTTADPHDVVTLRRISINGNHYGGTPGVLYNGVNFSGRGALVIEKSQISNFSNAAINFTPANGADLYVRDCDFTNNEFFGINISSTASGLARGFLDNVRFNNNGIFGTGAGLYADSRSQVFVDTSSAAGNGLHGFGARPAAATAEINIESSSAVGNNVGVVAGFGGGTAIVRISNVDVFDNTGAGIAFNPAGSITSFGNNRIAGNAAGNGPPTATLPQQ